MSYCQQLASELAAVRIGGAQRRRIVAEVEDHLACDPAANLGEPGALARQFADELGSRQAVRAALLAFGSLAIAGLSFVAALIAVQRAGGVSARVGQSQSALGMVWVVLSTVGAQVALVAGTLGGLRALRRRHVQALPQAEAVVLLRRAGVGLAGGFATLVGLAVAAVALEGHIAGWWTTLALSLAGLGALALTAAVPALLHARRMTPQVDGPSGDLSDDLRRLLPARLQAGSWRFALLVTGVVVLAITLAGVAQDDPFDGLLRGLVDGAACLAGYAMLGSYLGLSRERGADSV
jgi:hypothetical protein